jgi:hypothetical protein
MSNESGIAAVRLSRLDSTGQPVDPGDASAWALCDPVSGEITFNYDTGDEIIKKDGLGNICFTRKRADQLKGASPKITVCGAGPELIELAINGAGQILGGMTPTGYALKTVTCGSGAATERGGVFLEWWTGNYNCGAQDPTNPWIRHWVARAWLNYEGGTFDSGAHDYVFSGEGQPTIVNPTAFTANHGGPFQDITGLTMDASYLYGEQFEDTLPTCDGDYVDTALAA